jgi:hypothetical protein
MNKNKRKQRGGLPQILFLAAVVCYALPSHVLAGQSELQVMAGISSRPARPPTG